jgi:myo-inositol-1(or 4)-monophosphatase
MNFDKVKENFRKFFKEFDKKLKDLRKTKNFKGKEIVSYADEIIENELVKIIQAHFPEHLIVSEENFANTIFSKNDYVWFIDPIDNTLGFLNEESTALCSISLKKSEKHLFSFIYNFSTKEIFTESFFEEKKSNISIYDRLKPISFCSFIADFHYNQAASFSKNLWKNRIAPRVSGSAAFDLLQVALGKSAAHITFAAHPWDVEAGLHFVKKSGGTIHYLGKYKEINCIGFIAAQNQKIIDEILQLLD